MQPLAVAALAVVAVLSVALWSLGMRYSRAYVARHRARPPLTWMFRATNDPELERPRRLALALLPVILIALAVYLLQP